MTALVVAAVCWGFETAAMKYAVDRIPPMTVLLVAVTAAAVVLWTVHLARSGGIPAQWPRMLLLGLFEPGLAYAAVGLGLMYTSAANASLLAGTESLFVVLLAMLFLRARPGKIALAAVALGFVGVAVLGGTALSPAVGAGDALVLAGTLSAGIYVTLASKIMADETTDVYAATAFQFVAGAIVVAVCFAIQTAAGGAAATPGVGPLPWLAAIAAGVIGLTASFLLYNQAIRTVDVTIAGVILNLIPVFGVAFAVALLREPLTMPQIIGAVLIIASMYLYATQESKVETPIPTPPATPTKETEYET